jgi:tRNA threonylcarbamoyladenosine biosynthesis protein TsaB
MSAIILNIESATDICSICISKENEILAIQEITGNDHASKMMVLIGECLKESRLKMPDLEAVAISNGPGSYSSLRIGTSTAKGICYALNIPMIAIDTLESLALAAFNIVKKTDALYCPMIDARRMEVYYSLYNIETNNENTKLKCQSATAPLVVDAMSFSDYFLNEKTIIFCGNGAPKCQDIITSSYAHFENILCSARYLPPLSYKKFINNDFSDIAYHTPEYLKAPNITTPKKVF